MSNYDYLWYSINYEGAQKIGIVSTDGQNYTGTAKVFYSKVTDTDVTDDANSPDIPERFHYAIVWGVLSMLGFQQYYGMYKSMVNEARSQSTGAGNGSITLYDY